MKKLTLILAVMVLTASQAFGQCGKCGYEVKAENAYTNYNVRYASIPMDAKHYTTDRLRGEFAIEKVFAPGEVNWTYTMFDRFLIGGAEPTTAPLKLTSIAPLSIQTSQTIRRICSTTASWVLSTSVARVLLPLTARSIHSVSRRLST